MWCRVLAERACLKVMVLPRTPSSPPELPNWIDDLNYQTKLPNQITKLNCKTELQNGITEQNCQTELPNPIAKPSY
jgi:hypothetical protein